MGQLLERLSQGGTTHAERLGEVNLLDALPRAEFASEERTPDPGRDLLPPSGRDDRPATQGHGRRVRHESLLTCADCLTIRSRSLHGDRFTRALLTELVNAWVRGPLDASGIPEEVSRAAQTAKAGATLCLRWPPAWLVTPVQMPCCANGCE